MNGRRVVITGVDVVSPYGIGIDVFRDGIFNGKSASATIDSFDVSTLPVKFAAGLQLDDAGLDEYLENQKIAKTLSRAGKFLSISAGRAITNSGLEPGKVDPYRFGTSIGAGGLGYWDTEYGGVLGEIFKESLEIHGNSITVDEAKLISNTLEMTHPLLPLKFLPNIPTAHLSIANNARGNSITLTTACSSSAQAIGEAYRQIKFRISDFVIAGGSDAIINPNCMIMFSLLGVLSKNNDEFMTAARPFDKSRDGFMIGEGAAVFILEELGECLRRGATPLCEIVGYGSTSDAYRLTDSPPEAWGSVAAMKIALEDAGILPVDIDYINAHGTGTKMNDKAETYAVKQVFGNYANEIPISSTKSMIGHCIAAAGGLELAATVLAMENNLLPPTINYSLPDPECDLDYVPNIARYVEIKTAMSNSFGFGGQNAVLIIRKFD